MSLASRANDVDSINHYGYTVLYYANGEATTVYMRPPQSKDPPISMGGLFEGKENPPSTLGCSNETKKGRRVGIALHEKAQCSISNQA